MNFTPPLDDCHAHVEALSLWAAGCLSTEEVARVEAHLAECERCRNHHAQLETLSMALRSNSPIRNSFEESGRFTSQVMTALIESSSVSQGPQPELPTVSPRTREFSMLLVACIALGILAIFGLTWSISEPQGSNPPTIVKKNLPQPNPDHSQKFAETLIVESHGPTLMQLRRALEHSEESFNRLLASDSGSFQSSPHLDPSSLKELIP